MNPTLLSRVGQNLRLGLPAGLIEYDFYPVRRKLHYVGFESLTTVVMKSTTFLHITPCSL
jgi:hypothetical protein